MPAVKTNASKGVSVDASAAARSTRRRRGTSKPATSTPTRTPRAPLARKSMRATSAATPEDAMVIACAREGGADWIVTGDRDMLDTPSRDLAVY